MIKIKYIDFIEEFENLTLSTSTDFFFLLYQKKKKIIFFSTT
jgi:hypothetical protein